MAYWLWSSKALAAKLTFTSGSSGWSSTACGLMRMSKDEQNKSRGTSSLLSKSEISSVSTLEIWKFFSWCKPLLVKSIPCTWPLAFATSGPIKPLEQFILPPCKGQLPTKVSGKAEHLPPYWWLPSLRRCPKNFQGNYPSKLISIGHGPQGKSDLSG